MKPKSTTLKAAKLETGKPKATKLKAGKRKSAPKKRPKSAGSPGKSPKADKKPIASGTIPEQDDTARLGDKNLHEDFDALTGYLGDISGRSQGMISEFFAKQGDMGKLSDKSTSDPFNINEAFQEMMKALSADPGTVMQRQLNLWGDYAKLMTQMSQKMAGEEVKPAFTPDAGDKRFVHKAWVENPMLDFVKQSYLVLGRWLESTVEQVDGMDEHEKAKAEFFTRQFIDAFAPTNFAMLNPEVVEATIESKGENLLKGLQNLLEDVERGDGELMIRQTDLDHFKLGENIATTPGKVVFQNDILQLIQYEPTTDKVSKTPMLICPPWINKFYILDLQEKNSFVKWLVAEGRTVFIVSWVNPGPELRDKTFEDYIKLGLFEALDAVEKATGEKKIDTIGYCIGGTMLSTALSLMVKKGDDRINSATFFTAQADFSEAGDLLLFVDDEQLNAIDKQMDAAGGVLEGRAMANTFNMLRSNDLIWSFVIDNYMKGKSPSKFDLLSWNSDATRMPKNVHLFYLREFYQHNRLAKGEMVMDGERLDLSDVNIPIFMQAGETDHIAPFRSIYNTARLFASGANKNVTYMLAGSGHIAGVVNHPSRNKYHHSINTALPSTIEEWRNGATRYEGSWWPHWIEWLDKVSDEKVSPRHPGDEKLGIIEDAPGSYVKVKA
ncbi:MAG: class I poly(R)-hydroxyalkanoic acid synthase [Alphaproteobacteria bacterium]|nr:class I poly(R)-hydroxyalkanoic acid synthase [Alphaproteobacteria bacterium]